MGQLNKIIIEKILIRIYQLESGMKVDALYIRRERDMYLIAVLAKKMK